ncbi:hypothetical protein ES707_20661 [subsurface metagenome]
MDLMDVIDNVLTMASKAHSEFHAGRREKAENYLADIGAEIGTYLDEKPTPAGDVTESATSEKPTEDQTEMPAQVPGSPAQPAAVNPAEAARTVGGSLTDEKPTQ